MIYARRTPRSDPMAKRETRIKALHLGGAMTRRVSMSACVGCRVVYCPRKAVYRNDFTVSTSQTLVE